MNLEGSLIPMERIENAIYVIPEPIGMSIISYGKNDIEYSLERVNRKTLAITVLPDLRVRVRAPQDAEQDAIERVIRKRASWILRQKRFFAQFLPRTPARQYVGGETHLYLGKRYRLRIRQAERDEVKLLGGYICIFTQAPSSADHIRELLYQWYATRAEVHLRARLAVCIRALSGWSIEEPQLYIRSLSRQWGFYSPSGDLTLTVDLIRAPRSCIDYVILHELCHDRHLNHTREFYRLISTILPDWREHKLRLEQMLS